MSKYENLGDKLAEAYDSVEEIISAVEAAGEQVTDIRHHAAATYRKLTDKLYELETARPWQEEGNAYDAAVKALAWAQAVDPERVLVLSMKTTDGTTYSYAVGRNFVSEGGA